MIIGISGKKQHGKDTVANIIQYLAFDKRYPGHSHNLTSFSEEAVGWKNLESTWHRKQFASKLKQIVAILIGCKVERLEDNKFKETPLGDQWKIWYWTYKRDGTRVGHRIYRSEDEAIASHLATSDIHLVWEILTPRRLLQLMGTECGRDIIHPNLWVNALFSEYKLRWKDPEPVNSADYLINSRQFINEEMSLITYNNGNSEAEVYNHEIIEPSWLITDVRFPNEAEAIIKERGVVIRVNRTHRTSDRWQEMFPDIVVRDPDGWDRQNWEYSWTQEFITLEEYKKRVMYSTCMFKNQAGKNFDQYFHPEEHESETALDNYRGFSGVITNDGNFDVLVRQVKNIITNLKIFQLP